MRDPGMVVCAPDPHQQPAVICVTSLLMVAPMQHSHTGLSGNLAPDLGSVMLRWGLHRKAHLLTTGSKNKDMCYLQQRVKSP